MNCHLTNAKNPDKMRIYLDDERPMPANFDIQVKTAKEAIDLIQSGKVTEISLDHDLGSEFTGYDVAKFIEQHAYNAGYRFKTMIHTANPVGRKNILQALTNAENYWNNHV